MHLKNVLYHAFLSLTMMTALPEFIFSQPVEILASESNFNMGSTTIHKIIGHDPDHYYVLKHYGGQYHLEKLDHNLNLLLDVPVKLYEGLKTYDLEFIVHFHDELYLFVSRRKFSETDILYQKIDKAALLPLNRLHRADYH